MKLTLCIFVALFFIFFMNCKKDRDIVTKHDLKGMVVNNSTDSGLANVTVYLTNGRKKLLNTVTDAHGNFCFPNVDIHSNEKYNYSIYIESFSGGISSNPALTEIGITGTQMYFKPEEANVFFKPRVTPLFLLSQIFCNKTPFTTVNDSIIFYCTNNTFHKNVPNEPYQWGGAGYGSGNYNNNVGGYPMGKYNLEIMMWKSGVYSTKKDSIYLGWGANTSYTINW